MLSWVVKVVPQPPEPPSKKDEEQKEKPAVAPPPAPTTPPVAGPPTVQEKKVTFQDERKKEAPKDPKAPGADKQEAKTGEGNSAASVSQPGVLTWISGALPQPAVSLSRATSSCSTEENATGRKGMLAWIAQGLEKVVPQPDLKVKESAAAERPAEVGQEIKMDDMTARQKITVTSCIKQGIDKVVPQPEIQVRSKTDGNEKTEAPASTKAEAPPPEAPPAPKPAADTEKSSGEAEQQQPNMMGWIFSGIGRMLPQPVQKQDSGSGEVQSSKYDLSNANTHT
ncbi:putative cyclic nucleotide-gated cation channel beta-1-like [Scophthalmus maximus]|uniref:Putative cyclic nucleotide-gated cation channel beta-1-like n=1 Tax=Scophthalmus maximus TaxID=52904 RepID=A0A2U9BAQ7_SCOMX|nr:putative cyclic nucleotide-gated cation channel beta-1-like [Scophthalmus maximus]